jgi:hypothetical protein
MAMPVLISWNTAVIWKLYIDLRANLPASYEGLHTFSASIDNKPAGNGCLVKFLRNREERDNEYGKVAGTANR